MIKRTALERHLRQHGCTKVREGGKHSVWRGPGGSQHGSSPSRDTSHYGTEHLQAAGRSARLLDPKDGANA